VGAKSKGGGFAEAIFGFFRHVVGGYRSPSSLDVIKTCIEVDKAIRNVERNVYPEQSLQQELLAITAQVNWMCAAKQVTRDPDDRRRLSENITQLLDLHKELRPY
jgi:G:T-mismatch repair DNA endonuclease (very short patch repair protein)